MTDVTDQTVALEDAETDEDTNLSQLVAMVDERLETAKRERQVTETRWRDAYDNFRGHYGDRVKFTETEKSRAFIKITKTKVMAAYGQILEVLLGDGKLPVTISPTPEPLNIEEVAHIDTRNPKEAEEAPEEEVVSPFGYEGDGEDLAPGETLMDRMGALAKKMFKGAEFKEGPADEPEEKTIRPAEKAAMKMEKKIHDQLEEADAVEHVCKTVFEAVLLGSSVLKGPFVKNKEYPRWTEEGEYDPINKIMPDVKHVSVWNYYKDVSALNHEEVDWEIEVHKLTKSGLRALKSRPYFRAEAINDAIERGPSAQREWWEHDVKEQEAQITEDRYEVKEFWGMVDVAYLQDEIEEDLPEEMADMEEVLANLWVCNGRLIRAVLNPFKPARSPYHVLNYEDDLYNFHGVGVAENMQDAQTLMNGFARLAIDNAVLAGNMMIEVDESNLAPGQSMEVYPGKVWRRMGGAPGQAIFGLKFPSTANENMQMFDKFRQLADDATGIPSFSHGQTGVSGIGRTASGISMLMGAANLNTKTAMKNIDRMLKSLGEALFAFNMQFDPDPEIKGDLEVKASGTSSLIAEEVRSQKLLQLLQLSQDPQLAPIANREQIFREVVKSLDLDAEKLTLDPKQAAIQAKLLAETSPAAPEQAQAAMQNPAMGMMQQGAAGPQGAPVPSPAGAQNGGGNIAPATPSLDQNQPPI